MPRKYALWIIGFGLVIVVLLVVLLVIVATADAGRVRRRLRWPRAV